MQIAKLSGYFLVETQAVGQIAARGDVLLIGPKADLNQIATLGYRRALSGPKLPASERAVRAAVEKHGFIYCPPKPRLSRLSRLMSTKPSTSKRALKIAVMSVSQQKK